MIVYDQRQSDELKYCYELLGIACPVDSPGQVIQIKVEPIMQRLLSTMGNAYCQLLHLCEQNLLSLCGTQRLMALANGQPGHFIILI